MRPGWSPSIGCGAGDFTYDSVTPKFYGESISKSKPQYGKWRVALLWHSYEKAGLLKRCYAVDNSSIKGGAGGKGRNPRIGHTSLLRLQMKTDPGVRDPPKICQPPKYLSYPSNHSHMENEIKSHGKI